jgi:hypothetical protein
MKDLSATELIDLDVCVLNALELLIHHRLPGARFPKNKRYYVFGSGNALATGRIIFRKRDAVFANESTYKVALRPIESIDHAILISASGGKHAPDIAKYLTKNTKIAEPPTLLTCNTVAPAGSYIARKNGKVFVFPHVPEPYTYNTSTYMGMILRSETRRPQKEARKILQHIKGPVNRSLEEFAKKDSFRKYKAFYLVVPEDFDLISEMLKTKFVELFGRQVPRDVFTVEQAKHATTLVRANKKNKELYISFGVHPSKPFQHYDDLWGKHRLRIPLFKDAGYAAMMAVGYYAIGKIQAAKPPWFKESVARYCETAAKWFGKKLPIMVEYK